MARYLSIIWAVLLVLSLVSTGWAQNKIRVHLDWQVEGNHAPVFAALEKGFYRQAGLQAEVEPGQGSFDAIKMVGVGKANFGIADAGTMAKGVSQGIPVTMVASLFQDTPMVVVSLKKTGIKAPKDIEGHSIAMAPWESTMFVFKVFCKLNQVDLNKVKIIPLSFATKIPSLLSRKVDSLGGYILELGSPLLMGLKPEDKVEINLIKFSDYGVQMYSNGIIVNNKYLEENSANVKAFVKATMKGLEYAIANPGETAEFLKRHSQISQQLLLAKWKSVVPLHRSETTKKHGLGWMDKARWEFTQKIMLEYGGQKKAVPLEQLFTNKFLN